MTTAASWGTEAQLGFGAANPVTSQFEFTRITLQSKPQLVETEGVRGTRSRPAQQLTPGIIPIDGEYTLTPTPSELAILLPWILGGVATGTTPKTYPLAETLTTGVYCAIDRVQKVDVYSGVAVSKARFESREGENNLQLTLSLMALTETPGNAGTFPAISSTLPVDQPFTHQSAVLTANSLARNIFEVALEIDNKLAPRFLNSQTAISLVPQDREIALEATTPFTADEYDLFTQALQPGVAGSLVYVSGTTTLTFALASLLTAIQRPAVPGRQEIKSTIPFKVRSTGVGGSIVRELIVTM